MPGENVAAAVPAVLRAVGDAAGNVAHINEIVPPAHRERQPPRKERAEHCRHTAPGDIARPDDAGREHDARVQTVFRRGKDERGRLRLALGIIAGNKFRRNGVGLRNRHALRLFGQRMDGTDIHELADAMRGARPHNGARPVYVYAVERGARARCHRYDTRRVDNAGVPVRSGKELLQRGGTADIALRALHALRQNAGERVARQYERPYRRAAGEQLRNDRAAEKARRAGHKIGFIHSDPPPWEIRKTSVDYLSRV